MPVNLSRRSVPVLRPRWDFLVPLLFLIVVNIPYLNPASSFFPMHDALNLGQVFLNFYREYFVYGDIPRWTPLNWYGISSEFDLLTPAQYFSAAVGSLFGVEDGLPVFLFSSFLEELFFLLGMYWLASYLFKQRWTIVFVCLAAVGTIFWATGGVNFKAYAALPFVMLFLLRFADSGHFKFLFLAGLFQAIMLIGYATYFLTLYLWMDGVFLAILLMRRGGWSGLRWRTLGELSTLLSILAMIMVLAALFQIGFYAFEHTISYAPLRSQADKSVPLEVFLGYGMSVSNIGSLAGALFPVPNTLEWSVYLGPILILFLLLGLFKRFGDLRYLAFVVPAVILVLFSIPGSGVPEFFYQYVPWIKFARHLEHTRPIPKWLLLVAAGFGFEAVWECHKSRILLLLGLVLLSCGALISEETLLRGEPYFSASNLVLNSWGDAMHLFGVGVTALVLLLLRWCHRPDGRWVPIVVLGLTVVHFAAYQWYMYYSAPIHLSLGGGIGHYWDAPDYAGEIPAVKREFKARPYPFSNRRSLNIMAELSSKTAIRSTSGVLYYRIHTSTDTDPCVQEFRIDYLPLGVDRLLRARLGIPLNASIAAAINRPPPVHLLLEDQTFLRAFGCESPKVYLAAGVQTVPDLRSAAQVIHDSDDFDRIPVVVRPGQPSVKAPPIEGKLGEILLAGYSSNLVEFQVEVTAASGAWLVYADPHHPGWQARVDGIPQAIWTANLAFKSLPLSPGLHNVLFHYEGLRWTKEATYLLFMVGVLLSLGYMVFVGRSLVRRAGDQGG